MDINNQFCACLPGVSLVARGPAQLADVGPQHRTDELGRERAAQGVRGVGGQGLAVVLAELALAPRGTQRRRRRGSRGG